jgi:hypothetical protein
MEGRYPRTPHKIRTVCILHGRSKTRPEGCHALAKVSSLLNGRRRTLPGWVKGSEWVHVTPVTILRAFLHTKHRLPLRARPPRCVAAWGMACASMRVQAGNEDEP